MKQHPIPQNILDIEFKLFSRFTIREFVYMAAGIATGSIFLFIMSGSQGTFPPALAIILFIACSGIGLFFGLAKINDQNADRYLRNFIKSISTPTLRVWKNKKYDEKYADITPKSSGLAQSGDTNQTAQPDIIGSSFANASPVKATGTDTIKRLDNTEAQRLNTLAALERISTQGSNDSTNSQTNQRIPAETTSLPTTMSQQAPVQQSVMTNTPTTPIQQPEITNTTITRVQQQETQQAQVTNLPMDTTQQNQIPQTDTQQPQATINQSISPDNQTQNTINLPTEPTAQPQTVAINHAKPTAQPQTTPIQSTNTTITQQINPNPLNSNFDPTTIKIQIDRSNVIRFQTNPEDITLQPNNINVRLIDINEQPISKAVTMIKTSEGEIVQVKVSDDQGWIKTDRQYKPGRYTITFQHPTFIFPEIIFVLEGGVYPPVKIIPVQNR